MADTPGTTPSIEEGAAFPERSPMKTRIYDYGDPKTGQVLYSFLVMLHGRWHRICDGSKPILFETAKERDAKQAETRKLPASMFGAGSVA